MQNDNQCIPHRSAGVLLPVSSIPSPHGIGAFGSAAREWVDFLSAAGQSYWQVLPLGSTGFGDSPYQSFSAFAGNPYYIDLDTLCSLGLLRADEINAIDWGSDCSRVNYSAIYRSREAVLRKAYSRFGDAPALEGFMHSHSWLEDYALFMAAKAANGNRSWPEWQCASPGLEHAETKRSATTGDMRYYCFVQYIFFQQWQALKQYANEQGVEIIGDIPIYVSLDSADTWANRELFQMDENGLPTGVAGCPPDSFAPEGQLWGNPLYNWEAMKRDGYSWWLRRISASFEMYDVLRIDHFRGIESYYAIPSATGADGAAAGRWMQGPGRDFLAAINNGAPGARIIAEDLGFLTPQVIQLLSHSGYPGMKVLQFAFDSREPSDYLPHNYPNNCVVYTGTHDNDTVAGWAESAPRADVEYAMAYMAVAGRRELPDGFIRLAMQSVAQLAVIPMQDWLGLGSEARFNVPSTVGGHNWQWRLLPGQADDRLAHRMKRITRLYQRDRV